MGSKGDALDLLEEMDRAVDKLFRHYEESEGPGVVNQASRGSVGKQLVRYLSMREAAKADIARVIDPSTGLGAARTKLIGHVEDRRSALDSLDRMIRHVRAIDISRTRDADGEILRLRAIVGPEIEWELGEGIGTIEAGLATATRAKLHRSRNLARHAPTQLDPHGSRWYERAPVVGWLLTKWDRMQDRPRPTRASRIE